MSSTFKFRRFARTMIVNQALNEGDPVDSPTVVASEGTLVGLAKFVKITLDKIVFDDAGAADIANSRIIVPAWVKEVNVNAHLTYPNQNVGVGQASIHLWRNLGSTSEAHYHNRVHYPALAAGSYFSIPAITGWIPVLIPGEAWTVHGWQNTGGPVSVGDAGSGASCENWLQISFRG